MAIESFSKSVCMYVCPNKSTLNWDVPADTQEFETSLEIFPLHFMWTQKSTVCL